MAKLLDKREQFCQQFLTDANGTQAAIRAGYAERSAHVAASRLLRNDKVQHRIAELFQRRAEKLEIDHDRIVRGLLIEAVGRGLDTISSARIKAWVEIARLLGHDPAVKMQVDLEANSDFQSALQRITDALMAHPEAAAAVAAALGE